MYLKPLTKFLKSLVNGDRFRYRWIRRPLSERQRRYASVLSGGTVANPAQLLEERSLLSAQLVSVIPNTGGFIYNGTTQNVVQTEAPRELKLTFSPGAAITNTPSNLAAISVTRAGGDGTFGNSSDQPVTLGFIGVAAAGDQSNQVTLRFADTLPDDTYRVTITSSLKTTTGDSFAGPLNVDFKVDYGSQVVSVVPQPVVRIESLNVLNVAKISDGDRVALTAGGTTVTFEFDSNNSVGQGNKGIAFTQADTRAVLAGKITTAINAANSGLNGIIAATTNGTSVNLEGAAFTPTAKITAAQAGGVSYTEVATGGLVQKRDTIVAYFNQNPLDPTLAQDPGFYRAINTADGSILLPQSVLYSSVSNSAVLKFATDLPTGTWNLKIGAPNVHQNTLATAINQGTLFSNTGGATIYGFLGNLVGTSVSKADVDLYQFSVVSATTVDINASNLAPGLAGSLALRLFDAQGNEVAFEPAGTSLSASIAAGTYYLGISSPNNDAYNPVNGDDAIDGIGFGSYKLNLSVNTALPNVNNAAADTTSFGTASNVGVLGAAGQVVDDRIAPLGNLAYPTLPGGADEPGHRDIGAVVGGESNSGSYLGSSVPGSIPVYYYNFQDVYGFDPQGNTLHNAITENQKQRAREIFDIFGRSIGKKFVETSASGLTVVTGDIRAVAPGVPPDAVGGIAGGGKVIMNANLNYGSSEYGGSWFGIAFHEIGHALGLEHSYDVPGVMGQGVGGGSGVEPVYPGDINLVPVMSLNPPNSTDINVYQFQVPQGGTFTGEVVAQRRVDGAGKPNPSLLDSALTLYKQDYTLAEALSDFGTNGAVQLKFVAKPQGTAGNGISLAITKADLGASVVPTISVVGNQINVVLNTNAVGGTTAQKLVDAINNDANAKLLVTALLPGGGGTVNVASPSITYSPITLLGGTTFRTIVARNDDYFGRDSFLNLHLDQGTYFLAVSSTGNTAFDPTVSFTGFGGRTDGDYRLNMNFTPDPATSTTLNDAGGRALDGDGNAAEGGTFNFWFRSNTDANTIYVDKANSASVNQNGSLGNPFATISAALAAANQGQVVRIVGNGGTDNDLGTINDARPYLIGFDSQNKPAADGTTFVVPKDVTVMIDAGALFKLQGAVIDAGNTVPNISRSGGALQILGTPTNQVHFTSLRDNSKGGNTDPTNFTGVQRGNWGGLVFRQESDVQGLDYRGQGIFLNSVNQANFQYGGGQVLVDSVLQIFNPVHITNPNGKGKFFARPTVWFNTITNSADAAISVDPNSFYNSLDRVGPDIHGNRVIDNTINGLFIRIRTNLGEPVDKLEVPARIDESDITYVLSENLFIKGTPGGPLLPNPNDATRTGWDARVAGSLVIDPGVIFKQSASRIEAQVGGSQLIAEGTLAHRVIFTSLKDDSYGAGGTFDTGADGLTTGTAGDYGGLMFNATSSGSIDQARITFAGGTTPIAGGFTQFNPVEIQQAHVRVANTLFQNNSDGILGGDQDPSGSRNGLLNNGSAALFVRGAQPVIVKNTFVGNKGDIISVNVNALNSFQMADWGRSTGAIDDFEEFVNNHGPLVRLNTYANNTSNGMKVRAETITAESVWDDTDIVHIVSEEINDNVNLHTYGGIRLQSTPDASLVVKLRTGAEGSVPDQPGFNANTLAANDDGFTGLVPIGFPVNFYGVTSSQLYVNNNGAVTFDAPLPTFTPFDLTSTGRQIIAPFFGDVDTRSAGSPVTYGTGTVGGRPAFGVNWLNVDYFSSSTTHTNRNDFRLIMVDRSDVAVGDFDFAFLYYKIQWETGGASGGDSNGLGGFSARAGYSNGTGAPGTFFEIPGSAINGAFLDNNLSTGLIHNSLNSSILGQYIFHVRGGSVQPTGAGIVVNGTPLDIDDRIGGTLQVIGTPGHPVVFTSFRDDTVGAGFRPDGQPQLDTNGDGIVGVDLSALQPQAGDWNGLVLDKYSNDRNVSSYIESEQISNRQNVNATPGTAEFVGSLAPGLASDNPNNAKGGNDDQTVGFEIQGYLNSSTDADLYSFNATAGTEVWFDISRTSSSLNTVLELVDANGQVLAGSDDSAEDTTLVSTVSATARNLIKDPMLGGDFYTTNPRDAGFRVVLPGQPGVAGTYFILVRSKDAQTQGEYRLQVRLQQVYEHPGSTIRFADIRYAVNGIQVRGLSNHSPLSGDSTSIGTNNSFANAQGLGNLLTSNNNTISVSGALNSAAQVDWYKFDLNYDLIQSIGGVNGADKTWSTIFDIDYADGIARGDLTLAVYDKTGRLVMMGRDSNVVDDQPGALQGNGLNDLSRGSVGKNDPFIGPVMLPAGTPSGNTGSEGGSGGPSNGSGGTHTYYVAVMSNVVVPTALDMYYRATATNSLIRLEPVNSVKRVVEDHIGFIGHTTGDRQLGSIKVNPTTPAILPVATGAQLGVSVRPYSLTDVVLYANTPGDSQLHIVNPFTGAVSTDQGVSTNDVANFSTLAIQMRSDGTLWGYQSDRTNDQNVMGRFVRIDPATGAQTIISLDGIPEYNPQTAPPDPNQLSGTEVDSFTWIQNSTNSYELYYAAQDQGFSNPNYNSRFPASRLYRVNPTSGVTALANTPYQVVGEIATSNSDSTIQYTKGMAFLNGTLYGVSSGGKFYTISLGNGRASIIRDFAANPGYQFTGLTVGPQNLAGGLPGQPPVAGFFADKLFATTTSGLLVCLSTSGELLPVFAGGSTSANLGVGGIQGITFSPLDFNLWHPTMQRSADPGHGINPSFDNTRNRPQDYDLTIAGRDSTQASGGASFYFGMENWVADPAANHYLTYGPNAQYGILNSNYHEYLTSNPGLSGIGNNYNLPGGAYGSLITNSFSLATYDYGNKPTLYFNYFLDTEDANSLTVMRDSARVFVTTNDGTTWQELATNNSIRSVPGSPAELPTYPTASALENSNAPNQQVQELFDTSVTGATPGWRQARVDLGNYAGLPNLKLRFDFSTAGAALRDNATQGIPGDVTGVGATDARRARDNSHVGFYIDDILIGLAGRGEVSTASVAGQNTTYQPNPGINADPNVPKQILTGPYQLEVRRGEEFGANVVPSDSPVLIYQQFDITERMANGWSILAAPGASLSDGATFTITDGVDTVTFEFSTDNTVAQGNVRVGFANGDSRLIVARSIRDAINGAAQNGMFKVTAKLGDDTPSGNGGTNFRVDLYSATDVTTAGGALTLTAVMQSTTVSENGGTTNVVVTRQGDTSLPLQVTLTAIDPSNGSPATFARFSNGQSTIVVTIPANASSASFPITGVDDSLAQGARTIVVRPAAVGFTGIATVLDVLDDDVPALTIQFIGGSTVNEGGTRSATVTRNTPTGQALVVNLASLNSGEISVPATVTIAAGQTTSPQFTITGLQDGTADGNQVATVAAHATGLNAGLGNITVVDNGIQFPVASPTANVNVTATGGNQSNGTIAADPTTSGINQRLFMASHIDTLTPGGVPNRFVGGLQVGYSNDAGQTWTLRVIADGTDATIPTAIGYPAVASDGFGNLFLAYLNLVLDANNEPVASNRVVVLKSSDFGQTFTLMQTFTAQNLTAGVGAPAIAAAKLSNTTGSVWVSYYDNNLGKLLVIGAPVTGLGAAGAFGGPQTVGGSDNAGLPALFPAAGTQVPNIAPDLSIAPGPTGQVMVGFQTQTTFSGQGASTIFVSVDPDGLGTGASFPLNSTSVTTTNVGARDLLPAQNGTGHGINAAVGLAYDRSGGPRNGRVYMVYTSEAVQEQNNTNILLRFSDNNGATGSWSAPIQINSDTTLNSQFLPRISVDQTTGDVAIVWYDARNDVVGGSGDTDGTVNNEVQLWGAIASYPVGIAGNAPTIGPNVKISAGTSKSSTANNTYPPGIPTPPTGFGNIDFGDDIGVAFHQGVFYAMWADNSTALGNNPTLPKLDIATAAVIQTPTPPVPLPVAVVGTNQNISLRSGSQSTVDVVSKVGDSNILFAASNNRTGGVGDPRSGLFVTYSTNGGLAWNGRVIANGSDGLPAVDPLTAPNPVVATDNQGNLFLAYRTATSVVVLVSTDFGQTFSATPIATFGAGTNFDTRFSLTAGSGGVWIALADLTNNQIVTSQATVTGLGAANIGVFSAVAAITGSANGRNPVIALGPTGQAFVSFQVNGATTASILTSLDADGLGAGAFSAASSLMTVNLRTDLFLQNSTPVPLAPGLGLVDPGVGLAWDRSGGPNDGRLYMVYVDRPTTAALDANLNVFVRYSDNNGATWSAPQRVNDDFGNTNTQFLPRIAVDQAAGATRGNVAVTWYDARNDWGPGSSGNSDAVQNNDSQFWGAIGTYQNNRLTFTTNAKISQGTSRASLELTVGEGFGRYTGLDYNAGRMVPVWADNSTQLAGNPDGTARMDLATAVLGLTVPPVAQVPRAVSVNFGGTTSINENGGLAVGTTTLLDGSGNPLIAANSLLVTLTTNDATLASVPGSATILGGTSSRTFNVTGTNNALAQGPRTLIVTPNVTPLNRISSLLTINDDETPQLTVSANFNFDDEGTTLIGTVTRNTSAISPLTVLLSSTDTSELQVPASVVIPANQSSATFIITLLEDFQIDGTRQASIIASVEGMRSGSTTITVGDTQVEAIQSYNRLGDRNLPRHQGALQITSNTISHTLQTAILVSSGARDAGSANLPHPGSVTNGPTLNNARLVPGPQISNNVIYDFRMNGIVFSGDANPAGNPVGAAPYGRIVNNTLYGGDTAQGTGIAVSNNAAPTLLNNIVANTARALSIDATSSGNTVIGTTLFKGNTQTGPNIGTNPILLSAADPLFVNPTKGNENFYLKAGTALVPNQAIDSSLNTLQDRPSIVAVKSPLGIPESPITAPGSDRFGQLRIDDPNTPNATGLGQNIFKDRGAVERADFTGPASRMFTPLDNQLGVDGDPADDTVFIITPVPLTVIEVELTDVGIGIDNATVQSTDFILTRDGVVMVKDVDYTYSYNTNTHRAAFKSVSIFPSSSNYVVSVNTTGAAGFDATPIADRAGNALKPNQPNGSLLLKIVGNVAPTLTSISPLPGLKNITQTITYQQLKNASDLSVLTGHTADFRIESVVSGTLTISKNGAPSIAVVPGTTLIEPGDTLTWVQVAGATGITPAFKVIGYDPENAVVAPALSQSSPEVTVSVNLVNVAPTLTTIAPLSNGTEDTPYVVTYSTLVAASDLSDQNNDTPLSFQISQVTAGTTLQSSRDNGATYQPVVPGTTLVSNGDQLRWTPAANANSTINGGPLNAFTVVATDGAAVSLTAIQVKVDVAAVPDAPILTGFAGPFGLGGLNSQFKITYNDLVSTSDVKNVDGHAIQFRIESLPAGASMQIKSNGVLSTAGPGTIVSAGDSLFWTPPLNQFGQGNNAVSAFIVVAYDAFNHVNAPNFEASAPAVTAKVNVLSVAAPTLTTITTFTPPRYVPTNLTYTQIRSASDVTIPGSNVLAFRVESVQANIGTITITKSGTNNAVPLVAGQTLIESGDVVTWTSLTGASGLFTPFTVLALDKTTTLRSQEPVPVNVNLINYAPTLTSISTLSGGVQQTAYPISYATLKQNSNAQDANNDVLSFRIETISNGTLTITRNNVTSAVVPGTTQVVSGDTLTWTPANGVSGSPVGAFTVVAFDGSLASSPPVQVNVNVLGLGASYDLTGPWVIGGRLARISQNGANLTISDENGVGSSGSFTGYSSITGRNNLTGAVDTSAADQGRILWSDGKIWLRISLGGQYYNPANNGLTSVAQNGVQLTFTNVSGGTSTGTFLSASQLSVPGWNQTATIVDGSLIFSGGSSWKKLNLAPDFKNVTGDAVRVIQNGTTNLTFVNKVGQTTPGKWISPTQVQASGWGVTGTVQNGQIQWSNNTVWNKNLTVQGTSSGQGTISLFQNNSQLILTNRTGGTSRAQITGSKSIKALDWGATGTVMNGKIMWNNGTVWDNFDFNALDSVFADIRSFPFGL